jgi:hypothetical protein
MSLRYFILNGMFLIKSIEMVMEQPRLSQSIGIHIYICSVVICKYEYVPDALGTPRGDHEEL